MSLRLVFMGTPAFAAPSLRELIAAKHDIAAVYCQPPRAAGRGMAERKSPVQTLAEASGLRVMTPANFAKSGDKERFLSWGADAAVVVAYGLLLPSIILEAPSQGCFNLHPSALPRWRGAAPIQRAVMAGDKETAVCVMRMEEGLDAGAICLSETVPLSEDATFGELHDQLAERGAKLMTRAMAALERSALKSKQQAAQGVTYAAKIDKTEARIDFRRPAREVHNLIRGLSPVPSAWFEAGTAERRERIKVLRSRLEDGAGEPGEALDDGALIACGGGAVRLIEVQRAGKKPVSAAEFLRGFPLPRGAQVL